MYDVLTGVGNGKPLNTNSIYDTPFPQSLIIEMMILNALIAQARDYILLSKLFTIAMHEKRSTFL